MAYTRRMAGRNVSKRLPRHLRNEDIPRNMFTPKTYQVELLDSAIERNTVVCMGSTSGRMFISVMLMKEMARDIRKPLSEGGKKTIFLVDTDDSIDRVSTAVLHPVDFNVNIFTNKMDCLSWSKHQWETMIDSAEAFIMTGTIFLHVLNNDIISMEQVNLLILDNCHMILQTHPYQDIMKIYKSVDQKSSPRILGLTSNILEGNFQNPKLLGGFITSLEDALQSVAETSSLVIPERYGIRPNERIIECNDYEDTTGLNDQLYAILENSIVFMEECNIEINEDLDNRDPCQIPRAALIECHNILTQLGPWCAACLADMLIQQIEKIEKQKEFIALHKKFLKIASTALRMVSKIVDEHFKHCEYSLDALLEYTTPKVAQLMDSLRKYRPQTDFVIISEDINGDHVDDIGSDTDMSENSDFSENEEDDDGDNKSPNPKQIHVAIKKVSPDDDNKNDPFSFDDDKNLCGIVFVDHQHEAYALNKFIEEACAWDEGLCFVKSCHLTGNKAAAKKKLYKKQEETLRKFRMQELNLLVSTNVLEEGVDVPKCNFVARFDVPKSYKSYSHSKGRARARDAEYLILVEEEHFDEFDQQLKTYHDIEKVLIRRSCRVPDEPSNQMEATDDICDCILDPYVPSNVESNTSVTMETAIMLVNRYCAKLPSDAFTHLTPACNVQEVQMDGEIKYIASIRLPINSPIKEVVQGLPMSTKLKAKQAVALKMCEILHKQGELDDNLMPVGKEMFERDEDDDVWDDEEDIMGEARPGTTKRKQYYSKRVAQALQGTEPHPDEVCYLYIINMVLTGPITDDQNTRGRKLYAPENTPRCFGILTTKTIPLVPMFPVFTRSGEVTVAIDPLPGEVTLEEEKLDKLKTFHRFLFSNVLRLEKDPMDYLPNCSTMGYLVVPLNKEDEDAGLEIDWKFTEKVVTADGNQSNPKKVDDNFVFNAEDFEDAVVMPSYRNIDQPQYFYVAEIRSDLNPMSPFPSPELYKTFAEYYSTKYGLGITNPDQPLLDVDHTSARLNLLIPRYMNQKGVPLPTSSAETKKARRENLQQKQILVPELCDIHVFLASLWRKAVCLPAILYRMNYLLLGEEIRKHVSAETKIGISELADDYRFPKLDFGIDTSPEHLKLFSENAAKENDEDHKINSDVDDADDTPAVDGGGDMKGNDFNDDDDVDVDGDNNKDDDNDVQVVCNDIKDKCNLTNQNLDGSDSGKLGSHLQDSQCNKQISSAIDNAENICDNNCIDTDVNAFRNSDVEVDGKEVDINNELKIEKLNVDRNIISNKYEDGGKKDDENHILLNGFTESICKDESSISIISSPKSAQSTLNGYIDHEQKSNSKDNSDLINIDIAHCVDKSNETVIDLENENYEVKMKLDELDNGKLNNGELKNDEMNNGDIFTDVGTFYADKKSAPTVDITPEPLISLDEDMDLSTFIGPSPCEILQALTMSNANDFFSLERLETIGDSFLKYAITVYLYCSYPGIHEGKLSYLRSKQVSNFNLYRLGKRKCLAECMISSKFEPYENWLPPGYVIKDERRKGPVPKVYVAPLNRSSSSLFSCCMEDIVINTSGNKVEGIIWNQPIATGDFGEGFESELEEADQISRAKDEELLWKEKSDSQLNLIPYSLQLHHCLPDKSIADCVEALIGCYLTSCDKMAALRLMSWMGLKVLPKRKLKGEIAENIPYEKLPCPPSPFLSHADNAEYVLSSLLDGFDNFEKTIGYEFNDRSYLLQAFTHASYHFNTVTDCYQRLEFLGDAVLDYVITRHLYEDSDRYSPGVLTDLRSALVNNNIFAALAVKWNFHKYFKAISPSLFYVIEKFVSRQKDKEDEIDDEDDEDDEDHEKEQVELEVPKALGDIFESVAGAIYLDSAMSLDTVWRVFYRIMKPQIDKYLKNIPKSPVRELLEQEPETAKFEKPERTMDGKIRVTVNVVGKGVYTGVGRNYRIAKSAAAKKALRCIRKSFDQPEFMVDSP
ncbi:Endoribonuclease Dicer [Mactra antiquata]